MIDYSALVRLDNIIGMCFAHASFLHFFSFKSLLLLEYINSIMNYMIVTASMSNVYT